MLPLLCKLCGRPIEDEKTAWKETIGWVSPRGAKGMTHAHQTGELAHAACISLARSGLNVKQESLLGSQAS